MRDVGGVGVYEQHFGQSILDFNGNFKGTLKNNIIVNCSSVFLYTCTNHTDSGKAG